MEKYTQANRSLSIRTPLGDDALLLEKFTGSEAISQLFHFHLELLAEQPVAFDKQLGQQATVTLALPNASRRFFHGIIRRLGQGRRVPVHA